VLQTAATDVPRFDHNPTTGESLGLLVEEQRTNLLLRSEEFDNAYWTKPNSSTTQDAIAAPNGTITAEKLLTDTTSGIHAVRRDETVLASTNYTLSFYAKAAEYTFLYINHGHTLVAGYLTFFDLSTGTVGTNAAGNTASIQSVGNGWYRCSVTRTTAASQTSLSARAGACQSDNVDSFVGDTASGIYLWGAQLEAGSFPTSYIPTTTAAVTRNADVASITGSAFSGWYNAAEGTVFVDGAQPAVTSANVGFVSINDASSSNRFEIRQSRLNPTLTSSGTGATAYVNGSPAPGSALPNVFYKQAVAFGGSSHANYVFNSSQTSTTTLSSINANRLILGVRDGQAAPTNGASLTVSRLAYWPQRLANSTLQTLTQ
jgi:hypothetical protein